MQTNYYPEMGQTLPTAQIEATLGHYGRHYYLKTPLKLAGRGITYRGTLTASDLIPQAHGKIGWHEYKATEAAYRRICAEYTVSRECLLD